MARDKSLLIDGRLAAGSSLKKAHDCLFAVVDTHYLHLLALILLFALGLGIVKMWIDPPSPEFNWENRWWQIAVNVARGDGYVACKPIYFPFCGPTNQITAMREPLPVLLFALLARLTNESLLAAAASGVVINLATLVTLVFLTRELATTRVALLAGLLWSLYLAPVRLYYSQVSGDLLATLGITGGLYFFLSAQRTNRKLDCLLAGIGMGAAILSRSAVIGVVLALTACLTFLPSLLARRRLQPRFSAPKPPALQPLVIFTLAWSACISPWFIRNYLAFGRPVLGSTLSGYYLYRQSYMLPTDNYLRFVSGGEFTPVLQELVAHRPDLHGDENEAQMDQVYRQEGLRAIRAEPLRYLKLSIYRFLMLWFNWQVNDVYGKPQTVFDQIIVIQHVLFLSGGALGLVFTWRRAWPLAVSVAVFSAIYMLVMAHVAYIVPVVPLLAALTASGMGAVGKRLARLTAGYGKTQ